jgi:predicted aminopeptidase
MESAVDQAKLMRARVPLNYALDHYDLTPQQRERIQLAIKLRKFMEEELRLDTKDNYSRYVHLKQDYVTYAVSAAQKDQLKAYQWSFPIIGQVPYKGYFNKEKALEEEKELKKMNLDTHVRGVTAYSTLGWFEDPLLSSMLRMKEHSFVNTLIHETVHANLYIKSQSKFNERVASFLGQLGAEAYYQKLNRAEELKTVVAQETHDELLFSDFISKEMKALRKWYKDNAKNEKLEELRQRQFKEMQDRFTKQVTPKLQTKNYKWFAKRKLNNAFLLLLELYNSDFDSLNKLANYHGRDFHKVFAELKSLEDVENPEQELEKRVQAL